MSKYDVELDLSTRNSLSVIANNITNNSKILEFGPSHGRLTKYLKESLGCEIHCIEIDHEAAQDASMYSEKMIICDIEGFTWTEKIKEEKFDYIIFADVLEHLRNPKKVLSICKDYLKDTGSILISIPNIAHSSIIIDLLNDKFIYRDVGLLDDTHIKLFTKTTLDNLISEIGLFTKYETSIKIEPEETEFHNFYEELPSSVASYIKNLPYSNSYQFIMELVLNEPKIKLSDFENNSNNQNNLIEDEKKFVEYKKHENFKTKIKTVAFYLPQFHPFKENDEWWGKGFTEWTNVTKAKPNFYGHYQPHLPIHNGFYDLRVADVMKEQAKLAKNYGIYGFNFYYYWFGGKVLMHEPFEILLKNKDIDINFCITWANENWTRAWDASENEVLIKQEHSNNDSIKFIQSLYKYFNDERYIYIDNKPVLIIYRCDIIPNIKETVQLWREEVKEAGYDGIYLICAQTYGITNPLKYGFDSAMEFPPHNTLDTQNKIDKKILNDDFYGTIFDYNKVVEQQCNKIRPDYKCFETLMLSWDNTARKQNFSNTFANFTIKKYKEWLSNIANNLYDNNAFKDEEKLIFINAWNEWAEGTHLEPDREYGYNYLESTYDILKNYDEKNLELLKKKNISKKSENALILHIYEDDFLKNIKNILLKYNQKGFDLYITISSFKNDLPFELKNIYPNSYIKLVERRGEDVLAFIEMYKELKSLNYQKIWKEHTKKDLNKNFDKNLFNINNLLDFSFINSEEASVFLDLTFCNEEDKIILAKNSKRKENKQEKFQEDTSLKKIDNIISNKQKINELIIPKSNNLPTASKISLILKKIYEMKELNNKILLYGNGYLGKVILSILGDKVIAVIDKNIKQQLNTHKVIQPVEIQKYDYDSIVISVIGREKEVISTLISNGVKAEKIVIL